MSTLFSPAFGVIIGDVLITMTGCLLGIVLKRQLIWTMS